MTVERVRLLFFFSPLCYVAVLDGERTVSFRFPPTGGQGDRAVGGPLPFLLSSRGGRENHFFISPPTEPGSPAE